MGKYNFQADIVEDVRSDRGRIERLERAPQLPNSTTTLPNGGLGVPSGYIGEQSYTIPDMFTCPGNGVWRFDALEPGVSIGLVTTGDLLVTISAMVWQSINASNAIMSYWLYGPTTSVGPDTMRGIVVPALNGAQAYSGSSFSYRHTGLEIGSWGMRPVYRCNQYGGSADTAYFQNRTTIVKPY